MSPYLRALFFAFFFYQLALLLGLHPSSPITIVLAASVAGLLLHGAWHNQPDIIPTLFSRWLFNVIWLATALTALGVVFLEYYSFDYSNFDTGIYANGVAIFWQTGHYYSSILNMPALGEHFTPNLLLLAPLFALKLTFLWFPVVKLLAFLACPLILYRIGQRVLGPSSPLLWIAPILFCCHRYVLATLAMEFQPSGVALPFILLAFLFAIEQRFVALTATLLFLLGFKEHLALIWVSVGLYLTFVHHRKLSGVLFAVSGITFGLLIYLTVMPYFAAGLPNSHAQRFAPWALLGPKLLMLLKALFSVGFIPLFAPRFLPAVLCAFGLALISNDPLMVTFSYHYQDVALAVLFVGVIHGLQNLAHDPRCLSVVRWRRVVAVVLILAVMNQHTRYPSRTLYRQWPTAAELSLVTALNSVRETLRRDKPVWTLNSVGPYFFDFPNLRPIINQEPPFHPGDQVLLTEGVETWPMTKEEYTRAGVRAGKIAGVRAIRLPSS